MRNSLLFYFVLFVFTAGWAATPACAEDTILQADKAVADILFEYDFDASFATYTVSGDEVVGISFASDTPDELYSEVLNRLMHHSEIRGVHAGKTHPPCRAG